MPVRNPPGSGTGRTAFRPIPCARCRRKRNRGNGLPPVSLTWSYV